MAYKIHSFSAHPDFDNEIKMLMAEFQLGKSAAVRMAVQPDTVTKTLYMLVDLKSADQFDALKAHLARAGAGA